MSQPEWLWSIFTPPNKAPYAAPAPQITSRQDGAVYYDPIDITYSSGTKIQGSWNSCDHTEYFQQPVFAVGFTLADSHFSRGRAGVGKKPVTARLISARALKKPFFSPKPKLSRKLISRNMFYCFTPASLKTLPCVRSTYRFSKRKR
jgi:hypothetical protein